MDSKALEKAQMALTGPRDNSFLNEALRDLESDDSEDEEQQQNAAADCLSKKLFNVNSLCFLIKSRGYALSLESPLKPAIAIELMV
jgi:hypothetical protein